MKKRIKAGWAQASYTVEAAFIIPIIFGIIFALLYFLYYEHDKIVFRGNLKEAVICLTKEKNGVPDDTEWKKKLEKNLWIGQVSDGNVRDTTLQIKGQGTVQMQVSIPVMEYFLDSQQTIYWAYAVDTWQPEQIVRQKKKRTEIGEK